MNKTLLHTCCAPCSVSCVEQLRTEGIEPIAYWFNPNIHPYQEYKARRDTLVEGLKKIPGVIYSEPKGAFYVMAKLPVDDAEKFQLFMLEEFDDNGDTLMFTPAESFYKTPHTGVNEIRMAYVINQDALKRSMELLAKGIEAYNNK